MNKRTEYGIILSLLIILTPWITSEAAPEARPQEITVIGVSTIGNDQDSSYQNAVLDGFQKAVDKVHPSLSADDTSKNEAMKKDLILAQQELGITDYKVIRYWREQDNLYVELTVFIGVPKIDQPMAVRVPVSRWIYQTQDQILSLNNSNSMLALSTIQTIEVISPDNGKRMQWIKTGLIPHSICGERYLLQDGENLKLCSFKKFNAYNLLNYSVVFSWRKKMPDLIHFYLSEQAAYGIDRTGMIRAFTLEKGKEKWQLPANSRAELDQLSSKYLLVTLPSTELWIINENGVKVWVKNFEQPLLVKPVVFGEDLFCLFRDGQLVVYNLESGQMVSSMSIMFQGDPQTVSINLNDQKIFIAYNDKAFKGHLLVYHRFTGSLLWKEDWEGPVAGSTVLLPDMLIIGIQNTVEGRNPALGLKTWRETVGGQVKRVVWSNNHLLVVAGERLYGYELK